MKLLKKIFVVTLCITLMLSLIPVSASGATLVESGGAWQDIKYELFSDGTLVLSGEGRTVSERM